MVLILKNVFNLFCGFFIAAPFKQQESFYFSFVLDTISPKISKKLKF